MPSNPPHRSLREFDYFTQENQVDSSEPLPSFEPDVEPAAPRRSLARQLLTLAIATAFLAAASPLVWGFRDAAAYALAPAYPPLELGDVADTEPGAIPHNRFVRLHGVTEHRGMRQNTPRGLHLDADEFW